MEPPAEQIPPQDRLSDIVCALTKALDFLRTWEPSTSRRFRALNLSLNCQEGIEGLVHWLRACRFDGEASAVESRYRQLRDEAREFEELLRVPEDELGRHLGGVARSLLTEGQSPGFTVLAGRGHLLRDSALGFAEYLETALDLLPDQTRRVVREGASDRPGTGPGGPDQPVQADLSSAQPVLPPHEEIKRWREATGSEVHQAAVHLRHWEPPTRRRGTVDSMCRRVERRVSALAEGLALRRDPLAQSVEGQYRRAWRAACAYDQGNLNNLCDEERSRLYRALWDHVDRLANLIDAMAGAGIGADPEAVSVPVASPGEVSGHLGTIVPVPQGGLGERTGDGAMVSTAADRTETGPREPETWEWPGLPDALVRLARALIQRKGVAVEAHVLVGELEREPSRILSDHRASRWTIWRKKFIGRDGKGLWWWKADLPADGEAS